MCARGVGVERLRVLGLARLVQIFELQHGSHLGEGRERPEQRNQRGDAFVALAQPVHESVDEAAVIDAAVEFLQFVANCLHALAVATCRRVALSQSPKLRVQLRDVRVPVILKQETKSSPDVACRRAVANHQVEQLGGDVLVYPLKNGVVVLDPGRVVEAGRSVVLDMVPESAAPEMNNEEVAASGRSCAPADQARWGQMG